MWHHHGSDTPTSPGAILLHSSLMGGDRNMNNTVHIIVHGIEYIIDRSVHGQLTEKFAKQDMNYCPLLWFL